MDLSPLQRVARFRDLIQKKRRENHESQGKSPSRDSQDSSASLFTTPPTSTTQKSLSTDNGHLSNISQIQFTESHVTDNSIEEGEIVETIKDEEMLDVAEESFDHFTNPPEYKAAVASALSMPVRGTQSDGLFLTPSEGSSTSFEHTEKAKINPTRTRDVHEDTWDVHEDEYLERRADIVVKRPSQPLFGPQIRRIPKVKKPRRYYDGKSIPSQYCRCPVRGKCPHKPKKLHDCRTLAPLPRSASDPKRYSAVHHVRLEKNKPRKLADILGFCRHQNRLEICHADEIQDAIERFGKWIDTMRFFEMSQALCDGSQIIQKIDNLVSLAYTHKHRVTPELRDDLTMLTRRWRSHDYDPDIHRGIVHRWKTGKEGSHLSKRLDRNYPHRKSHLYYGAGDLINGQCWLNQIELLRDGAHGQTEGGIDGSTRTGARSIILSCPERRDNYADRDEGDTIYYMGTSRPPRRSPANDPDGALVDPGDHETDTRRVTDATAAMLASVKTDKPIRVIRSWRLPEFNRRRTHNGFRFDGLYHVVASKRVDEDRALYRFKLKRLSGQTRIRYELPNERQLDEFARRRLQEEEIRKGV